VIREIRPGRWAIFRREGIPYLRTDGKIQFCRSFDAAVRKARQLIAEGLL
jgi:hypothetical protein